MTQKILFFLKDYEQNAEIFSEYLRLFRKRNFETDVFDLTLNHLKRKKLLYVVSVLKTIKTANPNFIYVGDELFSKNVFLIVLIKKIIFRKVKIISLIASQYIPEMKFFNGLKLKFLLSNIDFLICRNNSELKIIRENKFFEKYKNIFRVYLGVPEKFFYKINKSKEEIYKFLPNFKKNYSFLKNKYVLCFSGRLSPEKGLLLILSCLKELPDNFALISAVKKDKINYKKEVDDFIVKNKLSERIIFFDDLKNEEMNYIYNISDLVVMPTTKKYNNFKELFGSVIAESMLCKTIVVGSDNGSIPEILNNKELIFRQDDVPDLLKVINYIYNLKQEEKEKIINDNYNSAVKKYSAEAFVGAIINRIL